MQTLFYSLLNISAQISSISIHIISIHTVSKLGHFLRHSVDYESVMVDGYQAAVHIWTTRQVHQWPVVSRTADLYTWDRCSAVTVDAASTWQTGPGRRSVSVDSARQDCDRHPHVSTPLHLCSSVPECLTHHDTALTTTTRCSRKKNPSDNFSLKHLSTETVFLQSGYKKLRTGGDQRDALILREWRLSSRTNNQ